MAKSGANRWLIAYIAICVISFLIIAINILFNAEGLYDILLNLMGLCPYNFIAFLSVLTIEAIFCFMPGIAFSVLVFLIFYAIATVSVLCGARSQKPWHLPAIVLLSIDTIYKLFFIFMTNDLQFRVVNIAALLINGVLFFLIRKIRKYATAEQLEQIPQKYTDNGLRDL